MSMAEGICLITGLPFPLSCLQCAFLNGSPQNTLVPGVIDLAQQHGVFVGGDDFKSGQTKFKSVLVDFLVSAGIKVGGQVCFASKLQDFSSLIYFVENSRSTWTKEPRSIWDLNKKWSLFFQLTLCVCPLSYKCIRKEIFKKWISSVGYAVSVWFTRTHRGLIPTDFIFFAQAILCSGGVRHIVRTALYSVHHLPFPSDRRLWGLKKNERGKERGKNVTVYSAAAVLKNPAEGEGNGVCASIHVHWAAARDTRGVLRSWRWCHTGPSSLYVDLGSGPRSGGWVWAKACLTDQVWRWCDDGGWRCGAHAADCYVQHLDEQRQGRQLGLGSKRRHQPCAGTLCLETVTEAGCAETRRHQQNDAAGCTQCILCRKQGTRCGFDEAVLRKTDKLFLWWEGWRQADVEDLASSEELSVQLKSRRTCVQIERSQPVLAWAWTPPPCLLQTLHCDSGLRRPPIWGRGWKQGASCVGLPTQPLPWCALSDDRSYTFRTGPRQQPILWVRRKNGQMFRHGLDGTARILLYAERRCAVAESGQRFRPAGLPTYPWPEWSVPGLPACLATSRCAEEPVDGCLWASVHWKAQNSPPTLLSKPGSHVMKYLVWASAVGEVTVSDRMVGWLGENWKGQRQAGE